MKISARVQNREGQHHVAVSTNDTVHALAISPKATGFGSSVNGGELLFLALATCYCNDIYREAAKRGIGVESVEVEVVGEFGAEGEGAANVHYQAKIAADADEHSLIPKRRPPTIEPMNTSSAIHEGIRQTNQRFVDAFNAGDYRRATEDVHTEDTRVLPPDAPVVQLAH